MGKLMKNGVNYSGFGSPGGSTVEVVPIQTTGTKIATITVDGVDEDLYAPEAEELPDPSSANIGDVLTINAANQPVWQAPSGGGGVNITNTSNLILGDTSISFSAYERRMFSFQFNGGATDTVIVKSARWDNPPASPVIIESFWSAYDSYNNMWSIVVRVANTSNANASWPVDDFMQIGCNIMVEYCVITQ